MSYSNCRFIQRIAEFVEKRYIKNIPRDTRGVYALLNEQGKGRKLHYDVVYIGMTDNGVYSRMRRHEQVKRGWTHFTVFEVHDNITREEIKELEGLIRYVYRLDSHANKHNVQLTFRPFNKITIPPGSHKRKGWGVKKV